MPGMYKLLQHYTRWMYVTSLGQHVSTWYVDNVICVWYLFLFRKGEYLWLQMIGASL